MGPQTTEAQVAGEATQTEAPAPTETKTKLHKYVVMDDAVVVTIGKKHNGTPTYTRVLKGGIINGNPRSEQIQDFVRMGALVRATSEEHVAELREKPSRTALEISRSMGAPNDPVQAPQQSVQPARFPVAGGDAEGLTE